MLNSKDVAELTTQILLAAMQNDKFSCKTAEGVAKFYEVVHAQIVFSDVEAQKQLGITSGFNTEVL